MLVGVIAGEELGVGDDHRADRLVVRDVGVACGVLPALDSQVASGVHGHIARCRDIAGGQGDVTLGRAQVGVAAHRQLRAGDGVGLAAVGRRRWRRGWCWSGRGRRTGRRG